MDHFSIREARHIVRDLFEPRPLIYWADFLASIAVGLAGFSLVPVYPFPAWEQGVAFVVSALAIYRASLFTHELTHLKGKRFDSFRVAWNLLCGIPFLMPSFTYYTHVAHHARKHYGTRDDGEYLPLGAGPRWEILVYLLQPFVIPVLAAIRFLVLTPLAWLSPRLRRWVARRASSMVMDPAYVRPLPTPQELRLWRLQEAACFLFTLGAAIGFVQGRLPLTLLAQGYLTALVILMLNALRTLGAHRFRHAGQELTFLEQLLDSVNYPHNPLISGLWAPVGLRFHALHHLFPSLPYHNLAKAHHRLMRELPANSPYRRTESTGLWTTLADLWRSAQETGVRSDRIHAVGVRNSAYETRNSAYETESPVAGAGRQAPPLPTAPPPADPLPA